MATANVRVDGVSDVVRDVMFPEVDYAVEDILQTKGNNRDKLSLQTTKDSKDKACLGLDRPPPFHRGVVPHLYCHNPTTFHPARAASMEISIGRRCLGLGAIACHDGCDLPLCLVQLLHVPEADLEQLPLDPRQVILLLGKGDGEEKAIKPKA